MEIKEAKYFQDFRNATLQGKEVKKSRKNYHEISYAYQNIDVNLAEDTEMYEVYHFDEGGENTLLWGISILHALTVEGECNMTRGHYHEDSSQPEIYYGLGGEGLLLFMDKNNECFAEKVSYGSVHYIHGNYAHRLINTGNDDLKVGAVWGKAAGHNYESVEKAPFPYRVFKLDNKIVVKQENKI